MLESYYRSNVLLYFFIFFSFLIQNEKSISKIKEKMQINVGK